VSPRGESIADGGLTRRRGAREEKKESSLDSEKRYPHLMPLGKRRRETPSERGKGSNFFRKPAARGSLSVLTLDKRGALCGKRGKEKRFDSGER